jgi:hypothetical protein
MAFLFLLFGCLNLVALLAQKSLLAFLGLIPVAILEIAGLIYVSRLNKRESVEFGYVCPRCHGPLWDGNGKRLEYFGNARPANNSSSKN